MYLILDMQKKSNHEKQVALTNFSYYKNRGWNKLTSKKNNESLRFLIKGMQANHR